MLSHVTIKIVHGPSIYLHETFLIMQACRMQGEDMPLQEQSIESLIDVVKSTLEEKEQRLNCTCEAHNLMLDSVGTEFSTLLLLLQKFDFRVILNYQSGGQIIADLFNFIAKKASINVGFYAKGVQLEVSCYIMERVDHDTVNLYNARPDYIAKSKPFPIFYGNK